MTTISKLERYITLFSCIVTILSFFISVPNSTLNIPQLRFFGKITIEIQSYEISVKLLLYLISEIFNAYFFSFLFKYFTNHENERFSFAAILIVFAITTFISLLFIKAIFFPHGLILLSHKLMFIAFYILSYLITAFTFILAKHEERDKIYLITCISYLFFGITAYF